MPSTITGFASESARTNAVASGRISASAAASLPVESSSNPVSSSSSYRSDVNATGADIRSLQSAYNQSNALLRAEQERIAAEKAKTIEDIKKQSTIDEATQKAGQEKSYAARSTNLVTSGGGFLGATQSQEGVLQNLKSSFDAEHTALIAKRDAAINAANAAYDDKDFALAKELANNAKELQNQIYQRKSDYADQQLKIASAQSGIADKQLSVLSSLSPSDFASLPQSAKNSIDSLYGSGFTDAYYKAAQAKNDVQRLTDLQKLINITPIGTKFTINGQTYSGLKRDTSSSSSGLISSALAYQLGVPSLAGKNESDIILSLALDNAPQWYKEYYKATNPELYARLTPAQINADWQIFKSQPDISAYAKSSVVTSRIQGTNSFSAITSQSIADAITKANSEINK